MRHKHSDLDLAYTPIVRADKGPKVTLVCTKCRYTARRRLMLVTACRGVYETPSEPATCPKGHGPLQRKD